MSGRIARVAFLIAAPIAAAASGARAQDTEVAPVVVVGVTPLGAGLDVNRIAAPVQTATGEDIDRSHALDLSGFVIRELRGVYANDIQNNPLQPDLNYRGFTAS